MFCPNCGAQVEDGTAFCSNCGAKIEAAQPQNVVQPESQVQPEPQVQPGEDNFYQQPAQEPKVSKKNIKMIAGIAVAVIAVIIVVKLVAGLFGGSKDTLVRVYDSDAGKSTLYLNNKKIETIKGNADIYTNIDKSAFYVVANQDAYYVKGKKLEKILSDCSSVKVAAHGKAAILQEGDTVYRYTGSKLEELADGDYVSYVAISGDGKSYAYTICDDDDDYISYVGTKAGKDNKVKDVEIFAISNDGKYFYGIDTDRNLILVDKKGNDEVLEKDVDDYIGLNSDGTELMFVKDGKTYVSVKGKEKQKVSGSEVYSVLIKGENTYGNDYYPVKSFKKAIVVMSGEVAVLSNKYEAETIVDLDRFYGITDDLSAVYYSDGGDLYYAKAKKNAKGKKLAEDVKQFAMSNDGKNIYYINEDDELCYIKGNGKAKVIDDDPDVSLSYAYVSGSNLYAADDDTWYCIKGKKSQKLKVDGLTYSSSSDAVYAYKDEEAYIVKGSSLKPLKGDFKEISSIFVR